MTTTRRRSTFGSVIAKQTGKGTRYMARYTGPDGRKHSAGTFLNERQAWAALDNEEDDIKRRRWAAPKARKAKEMAATMTVGDLVRQRLVNAELAGKAPGTLANIEMHARFVLGDPLADIAVAAMTRADGSAWYRRLLTATASPNLRRRAYMFLRSVLREAEDDGLIASVPLYVKGANETPRKKRPEILTVSGDELAAVVGHLSERYRAMAYLAAYSGLRIGELAGVRVNDIDWDNGVIHIRRQATRVRGEGIVERDTTKSEASADTAVLLDEVTDILREHVRRFASRGDNPLVFTTRTGGRVESSTIHAPFKRALERLGLDTRMRPHELRSTGATEMAKGGATAGDIQRFLRHEHPDMARAYVAKVNELDASRRILGNVVVLPEVRTAASVERHLRAV